MHYERAKAKRVGVLQSAAVRLIGPGPGEKQAFVQVSPLGAAEEQRSSGGGASLVDELPEVHATCGTSVTFRDQNIELHGVGKGWSDCVGGIVIAR
jgi:hypothetical protein